MTTPGDPQEETPAALLAGLGLEVRRLREFLEREFSVRPTRRESTHLRRRGIVILSLGILIGMQVVDLHSEACGPGHRAEVVVTDLTGAIIDNDPNTNIGDVFINAADRGTPSWVCGYTFPTHTHDGAPWPQEQHIAGILTYALILLGAVAWVRSPLHFRAIREEADQRSRPSRRRWDDSQEGDEGATDGTHP